MYFLYIIKSEKRNWFYVGSTDDINKRLDEHNRGKTRSTKAYAPFRLIYSESFSSKMDARKRELQVKNSHPLKRDLINKSLRNNAYS